MILHGHGLPWAVLGFIAWGILRIYAVILPPSLSFFGRNDRTARGEVMSASQKVREGGGPMPASMGLLMLPMHARPAARFGPPGTVPGAREPHGKYSLGPNLKFTGLTHNLGQLLRLL